jgi:hypothetical protein
VKSYKERKKVIMLFTMLGMAGVATFLVLINKGSRNSTLERYVVAGLSKSRSEKVRDLWEAASLSPDLQAMRIPEVDPVNRTRG